ARRVDARRGTHRAIALIRRADVAVVGTCRARCLHGIGQTGGTVPGTELGVVAFVHCCATGERGRLEGVVGTRAAAAGTRLGDVAATARGGAARGPGVARRVLADVARAVAEVRRADVAVVGARGAARLERTRRRAARPRHAVVRAVVAILTLVDVTIPAIGGMQLAGEHRE